MTSRDTIFALSSGSLPSGVAVIRLSGPGTEAALKAMAGSLPTPRQLGLRTLAAPDGEFLDRGLVVCFPGPLSFTGEDCGEVHAHGGRAVIAAILKTLGDMHGLRPAEAGEFTRRAFLHGKLDLTRAEGLADLIEAETEAERRLAAATSGGVLQGLYSHWRRQLIEARAMLEADLDFSDESDVPGSVADQAGPRISAMLQDIRGHISGFRAAEMIRDGYRVVIIGAPNAGKSSLLNKLAGREAAIVTDIPGTTRDVIQVTLDLGGYRVHLSDTAGIRHSEDAVEQLGVAKARERAGQADLLLLLSDGLTPMPDVTSAAPAISVRTKIDVPEGLDGKAFDHAISVVDGRGIEALVEEISKRAALTMDVGDRAVPTRQRHVDLLNRCAGALERALRLEPDQTEMVAEELRHAADALGRITGAIDVEDVLSSIFSSFCIGK